MSDEPRDGSECEHGSLDKGDGYCLTCDLIESRDFWMKARSAEISIDLARLTRENEQLRGQIALAQREVMDAKRELGLGATAATMVRLVRTLDILRTQPKTAQEASDE